METIDIKNKKYYNNMVKYTNIRSYLYIFGKFVIFINR